MSMTQKSWEELEQYQPRVKKLLSNSLIKQRLAHAYLFEGPKGTGKKQTSFLLAKSFFCENRVSYQPCGSCRNCKRIDSGNHPDLHVVEPDGLSIKKGQIQALQEEFSKTGVESNHKLYIIEHADKMTVNAANSLLKFLEEPHADTVAVLLTEQHHQIISTILSRCQVLSFQPLPPEAIQNELAKQNIPVHISALAAHITNDMEEALELSRNDWFAQARAKVIKLYEVLKSRKGQALLFIQSEWLPVFTDKDQQGLGLDLLMYIYRDCLSVQVGHENKVIYQDLMAQLKQHALQMTQKNAAEKITSIIEAKKRLHSNVNPQLLMEQLVLTLQEG
ncbi:DNA polymerase III subunit delta' [Bacillus lacus]|uniref:DNA polymerase III subunit delta' n=1 Tax=Metabacillus lacus TaxID=1983721 RepID=A0A7X2LXU5_9BACI|nr:DNA polymerase III subunit delta' [Metabacillus lacus]MRX72935.1 DNA polymerase III subunit delta' [Metabacillus lacus]